MDTFCIWEVDVERGEVGQQVVPSGLEYVQRIGYL